MPPELTKPRLKRRPSKKDLDEFRFDNGHARELEQKRSRGEVSCAECRRLKIKCDKKIPCQSCQRRGCTTLCPNGSLSTGQGTRFVLAATEHLHHRVARLSSRIRELEDALTTLHAKHSSESHPLLHEDLVAKEEEGDLSMDEIVGTAGHVPDMIDALGTLSISDHGISRFFGPTGGSESLLISNHILMHDSGSPKSISSQDSSSMQQELSVSSPTGAADHGLRFFSQFFPFTPLGRPTDVQELIESHLPSWERAQELSKIYLEQASWLFQGVTRMQLMEDLLPVVYRQRSSSAEDNLHLDSNPGAAPNHAGPHDLGLVFVVFAVAALVQEEPSDALGEHYHQIAKAALGLQPVLEKPSIVTIQVLHLMSIYNAMSGNDLKSETSMELTWSLVTLAAHLSQTIGLHRDSARWGLSSKMVQRRRLIFWDLFVADAWQSLNTGRPPSFSLAYIDCAFPQPEDGSFPEESFSSPFGIWQFRFAGECVADVAARTLTADAPSYATIMELDKKVREFPLPEGSSSSINDFTTSFQKCVLEHVRETILLYIHRSFFAQAIIEQPSNPLKSPYAHSFLAAYRASSTILKSVQQQFEVWPISSARFWVMWTFAFSSAVVFGTVVTRGPRSPLAQNAMSELEQACVLFSKAAVYSIRATKALPILTRLREKARSALAAVKDTSAVSGDEGGMLWEIEQGGDEDELSIFAGHTRFVSSSNRDRDQLLYAPPTIPPSQASVPHHSKLGPILQPALSVPTLPKQEHTHTHQTGDFMPGGNVQYPYVPSERTHQVVTPPSLSPSYGWSTQSPYPQAEHPSPPISQVNSNNYLHSESGVMSTYGAPHTRYPSQPRPPFVSASLPPTQGHPGYLAHQEQPPSPSQNYQHQRQYATPPTYYAPSQGAGGSLADLGIASRDSRLDARWSSFMEDSGLLDSFEPR